MCVTFLGLTPLESFTQDRTLIAQGAVRRRRLRYNNLLRTFAELLTGLTQTSIFYILQSRDIERFLLMEVYAASLGICGQCGALLRMLNDHSVRTCVRSGNLCSHCNKEVNEDTFGLRRVPNGYVKVRWVVRDVHRPFSHVWSDQKPEREFKLGGLWITPNGGSHAKELIAENSEKDPPRKAIVLSFDPQKKTSPIDTEIAVDTFFRQTGLHLAVCQSWVEVARGKEYSKWYSLHKNSELLVEFIEDMKVNQSTYMPKGPYYLAIVDPETFKDVCRLGNGFFKPSGGLPPRYMPSKKTNVVHVRFGK